MNLPSFFRAMKPLLEGKVSVDDTVRALGVEPSAQLRLGLAVYDRFCEAHRHEILESIYPVCRAVLNERWDAVLAAFFARCPPRDWELNANAHAFVDYVRSEDSLPAWLGDLADLEWWEWAVWVAPSKHEPIAKGARLGLTAGTSIRVYEYDVLAFAEAFDKKASTLPAPPAARQNIVLFWREPERLGMRREEATPAELIVLKAALEGLDLLAASASSGVPFEELDQVASDLILAGVLRTNPRRKP